MPDDQDQVTFKSPTTGAVQPVQPEHWDEAMKMGYSPVSHVVMYDKSGQRGMVPKGQTGQYRDQGYSITAPGSETQFEKDRPGKGISLEGSGTAAWETAKSIPAGFMRQQLGLDILHPSKWPIGQALSEAKAGWGRGGDPRAKLGEAVSSGLGGLVGMSGKSAAEHASRGEGGAILGEAAVPAATAVAAPLVAEAAPRIRPMLQRAAYKELPTTGAPQLTRGARATGSLLGAGTGAALGSTLGGPGIYAGGHAGLLLGPTLMERVLGTPELGDIRNPGPFAKIPARAPKTVAPATPQTPSPFSGMTSTEPGRTVLNLQEPPLGKAQTSVLGAHTPNVEFVSKFKTPEAPGPSRIIQPGTEAAKPPHVEGSYWSFGKEALQKAVMAGDRDAAIVFKQRFGELPPRARYLTDVAQGPTRGLYRSEK